MSDVPSDVARTAVTIAETLTVHPAEEFPVVIDFGRYFDKADTLVSGEAEVQSATPDVEEADSAGLGAVTVEGHLVSVAIANPDPGRYDLLITATATSGAKRATVLRMRVSSV